MMVPTLWFEEYIDMPEDLQQQFRFNFGQIPKLLAASGIIFVILGAALLVCGFIVARLSYTEVRYTQGEM